MQYKYNSETNKLIEVCSECQNKFTVDECRSKTHWLELEIIHWLGSPLPDGTILEDSQIEKVEEYHHPIGGWFKLSKEIKNREGLTIRKAARPKAELAKESEGDKEQWISVKDRLPSTGADVLVSDTESDIVTTGWYIEHEGWFVNVTGVNVTHWMPLPAPPIK